MIEICDFGLPAVFVAAPPVLRSIRNTAQRGHGSGTTLMLPHGSGMPFARYTARRNPGAYASKKCQCRYGDTDVIRRIITADVTPSRAPASTECASRIRKRR